MSQLSDAEEISGFVYKIGEFSGEFTHQQKLPGRPANCSTGDDGQVCLRAGWSASEVLETLEKNPTGSGDLASPTPPPPPTEPAAGQTPTGEVVVINTSLVSYADTVFIYGEVENRTSQSISVDQINAQLFSAGSPVGEEQGYPDPTIILPGERVPFEVYLSDAPSFDEAKFEVFGSPPRNPIR
jgi:hypothetical protein